MVDRPRTRVTFFLDNRKISEVKKDGFVLTTWDGEWTGEFTDVEMLKEIPEETIVFKRMVDTVERNGMFLRYIDPKARGFFKTMFPTSQTGCIIDKYYLEEDNHPFEVGDVLRFTVTPKEDRKIVIKVEYRWEDQIPDDEEE